MLLINIECLLQKAELLWNKSNLGMLEHPDIDIEVVHIYVNHNTTFIIYKLIFLHFSNLVAEFSSST